jgi:hypothetical protein
MGNIEENGVNGDRIPMIGKTVKIEDVNNSTALIIPKEFAKALGIENSRVSMTVLDDCDGDKHLLVTKFHKEIVIE